MKITICTSGRFHVADLARELIVLGHDVTFHSVVPAGRMEAFGVPRRNQCGHLAAVLPLVLIQRVIRLPRGLRDMFRGWTTQILDNRYARIHDPGDVLIGMSGLCVKSLKAARHSGARVLVERGSRHILSQKRILDALCPEGRSAVSEETVEREIAGYGVADRVVVGSRQAAESFVEEGFPEDRIFRNPYGVDLDGFPATSLEEGAFDVIMVGRWSRQKGCDLLSKVVLDRLKLTLLHVGPVDDLQLPSHPLFKHVGSVPQARLPEFYAQARVFAMPSRQDGFGMVYSQALACGLPIVGSTRSGAEDLAEVTGLGSPVVQAVPPEDDSALAAAVTKALGFAAQQPLGPRDVLGSKRSALSWREYGKRYDRFLKDWFAQ